MRRLIPHHYLKGVEDGQNISEILLPTVRRNHHRPYGEHTKQPCFIRADVGS